MSVPSRTRTPMLGTSQRRAVLVALLCVIGALALHAPTAFASAPLRWSLVPLLDTETTPVGMTGVSCPTSSLCIGIDGQGNVASSSNPVGETPVWSPFPVGTGVPLRAVSCASADQCVAVGFDPSGSEVLSSTDPTGGTGSWSTAAVADLAGDGTTELGSLSCLSSLCVAGGFGSTSGGELATSTDPDAGAGAWTVISVPTSTYISGVSCVTASLCVAVDTGGDVLTSSDPTAGSSAWTVTHITGEVGFEGISCPSATLCVAVDDGGNIVTSTDPTGGAGAWTIVSGTDPDPYGYEGVSCGSTTLCAAVDDQGHVVTATNPTGGATSWTATSVDSNADLDHIACVPNSATCVANAGGGMLSGSGDVAYSTNASGGAAAWKIDTNADGLVTGGAHNTINDISCLPSSLCVAVDDNGNVLTATNPAAGASAWTLTDIDGSTSINSVSCVLGPLCVAVDAAGNVLTSTDPTGGAGAWQSENIDGAVSILTVSCTSATNCIAGDADSDELTSTNPTGGQSDWNISSLEKDGFSLVSCPTASLCVGLNYGYGSVVTSTDPTGGVGAWNDEGDLDAYLPTGVFCLPSGLCLASDDDGHILWTTDPFGMNGGSWTSVPVEPSTQPPPHEPYFTTLVCTSASFCVAADTEGNIAATTTPTGTASAWTVTPTGGAAFTTLSCASSALCVAGGVDGQMAVGVSPQPATPPTPPSPTGAATPATTSPPTAPAPTTYRVTVAIQGSGHGEIAVGATDCTATCTLTVGDGPLSLTATAASSSHFVGWEGACSGAGRCVLSITGPMTLTATFVALVPTAAIDIAHIVGTSATFTLATTGDSRSLQCSLLRPGRNRPPAYSVCARRVSYRHLAPGAYVLYVRGVSAGGATSKPVTRRFRIR